MGKRRKLAMCAALGVGTSVLVAWGCAWRPVAGLGCRAAARARSDARGEGRGYLTLSRWSVAGATFVDSYAAWTDDPPDGSELGDGDPESLAPGWLRRAALPWTCGEAPWPGDDENDVRAIDARGWPLLCLWSEYRLATDANFRLYPVASGAITIPSMRVHKGAWDTAYPLTLPCRPVWEGLAVNSGAFAGVWWGVLVVPGLVRAGRRRRRGSCPACGYELRGALAAGCPECGWRRGGA